MLFKLGCMSNAFMYQPLEEALKGVRQAGFEAVDLWTNRPHMYPGDYDKAERLRIRRLCDDIGLEISVLDCIHVNYSTVGITPPVGPYSSGELYPDGHIFAFRPNGAEPLFNCLDPKMREARMDYMKAVIDMAVDLGVSTVESLTGLTTTHPKKAIELAFEGTKEIVRYAEKKKITVAMESAEEIIIGTPEEIKDMIDKIGSPYLKMTLDIGHLEHERRDIVDVFEKMKDYTVNVHVDDIYQHKYFGLVPGDGDIDWISVLTAIKNTGYNKAFSLEVYSQALDPVPAVNEGYRYLTECFKKI